MKLNSTAKNVTKLKSIIKEPLNTDGGTKNIFIIFLGWTYQQLEQ